MLNEQGSFVFRHNETDISELDGPIEHMAFDTDSNAAVVVSKIGNIAFLNRMTNEMFRVQDLGLPGIGLQWFGARLYVFERHKMHSLEIQNLQGITTLKSLFSEVWYEGYEQPAYVWQTSSASENYETKFSIVPLIVGSLKASFLALFVAIPLALGAAIYTSYFADPAVRQYLKPAIEMLEAVPSVVIGFIAAVWMVPIAEEFLLSVILFIVSLPILLVTAALLQSRVATVLEDKFDRRWEILVIILAVVLLGLFCFSLSDVWRFMLLGSAEVGEQKDNILNISKTTIVVAIALGVAISPSIYSLAEDALFEVPESIKQASFALGATKLQTLRRVIIAVAMPSILSAVMLGFGRAFGETMIVLMVTGNTPISDWNILEGLRSMTANLAIELQESSVNSTHFNTLFLTASILFIFTFIVNTAAEILRNRLRKVYTDA
jgi:phosphate transport system permease protein